MLKRTLLAAVLCVPQLSLYAQTPSSVFEKELLGDSARVTTKKDLPTSAWNIACREALTLPLQQQLREKLAAKLQAKVPEQASFIEAHIDNYRSWSQGTWLHCKADVSIIDEEKNLAALAVRAAWLTDYEQDRKSLNALVKFAMQHPFSSADAVPLIAKLANPEQQLRYLDNNLRVNSLTLTQAQEAVLTIWAKEQRWQAMIDLAQNCNSVECRRWLQQAEQEKEQEDAEKADDLSSYL
ncbi:MAG: hypothetical protein M0Q29_00675 [Thiopseudomonas sp.]|nr:hypothetical protein [Thiopseudomonas sp.]MCK9464380.1 hypothetical protein [Thiopseudomonas sp.]